MIDAPTYRLLPVPASGALYDAVLRRAGAVVLAALLLAGCSSDADEEPAASPAGTPSASPTAGSPSPSPSPSGTLAPPDVPPLGCPATYPAPAGEPWVPAPPTTQVQDRLVPDADPVEALLCRYEPVTTGPSALAGEVRLDGGLDRLRFDLDVPTRPPGEVPECTPSSTLAPHLMRLTYADGDLWLSATADAQGCAASGNGLRVTPTSLGERFAGAYETGSWPAS